MGIFLSHELSGTYQCAKLAADLANVDNVLFVDSTNVCLGEGLLVRMAAHLRDEASPPSRSPPPSSTPRSTCTSSPPSTT